MARIQLKQHYSGRLTNEQLLEPGVYEHDDPRIRGLADYLVKQGAAVYLDPPVPTPTPPPPAPPVNGSPNGEKGDLPSDVEIVTSKPDYDSMDGELLRAEATRLGILDSIEGTGKNGNVLVADLRAALKSIAGEDEGDAESE